LITLADFNPYIIKIIIEFVVGDYYYSYLVPRNYYIKKLIVEQFLATVSSGARTFSSAEKYSPNPQLQDTSVRSYLKAYLERKS